MKKKILIAVVLVLVAAIGIGLFFFTGKKDNAEQINLAANQRGWMGGTLGKDDILILKSISHDPGGDSKAEFYVYRIKTGDSAANYMHMTADQVGDQLEHVGNAGCTFIGGDLKSIYGLQILYIK